MLYKTCRENTFINTASLRTATISQSKSRVTKFQVPQICDEEKQAGTERARGWPQAECESAIQGYRDESQYEATTDQ